MGIPCHSTHGNRATSVPARRNVYRTNPLLASFLNKNCGKNDPLRVSFFIEYQKALTSSDLWTSKVRLESMIVLNLGWHTETTIILWYISL